MKVSEKAHELLAYRLADMLCRLNQGERLDVVELAATYQVNARTIQRDLNERFAFLPIRKEAGKYFLEGFYLGKLNERDVRHFAALAGVAGLFPALDSAFLRDLLDSRISRAYEVKAWPNEDMSSYQRLMEPLKQAVLQSLKVEAFYDGKARLLEPYKLIHHHGRWYLAAVESGETAPKSYRLAKLARVSVGTEAFTPDASLQAQIAEEDSIWFGDKIEVVLTVAAEAAVHFRDRALVPGQQIVKELTDGGLIVSSRVVSERQIVPIIRYWIPHVRVVSPDSVREACLESIRQYLQQLT